MSFSTVGSFTLGEVSVAATAAITLFNPLLAQFDLSLNGAFGLGALQADLSAQFNAALSASVDIGLQISNPLAGFLAALQAMAQLQAELQAVISLGIPPLSAELNVSASAQAALVASLQAKLGGLNLLLDLALQVKIPAIQFLGDLAASLSAGPIFLLAFQGDQLAVSGNDVQLAFNAGLVDGPNFINPGDICYGIVLVTKAPVAWGAIQATMRTS